MKIIDKYIQNKIIRNFAIIYMGFIGLMFIIQTLRLLKYIPASAIKVSYVIIFGGLLIPGSLTLVNGIISAIIIYTSYSSMLASNEIIAMKSSGFSQKTIITPAIKFVSLNFTIFSIISCFIHPIANRTFDKMILDIKDGYVLSILKAGEVTHFQNTAISYDDIEGDKMTNFTILQTSHLEDKKQYYALFAKYAKVENSIHGAYLILEDANISKINIDINNPLNVEKNTNKSSMTRIKMSAIMQKAQQDGKINEQSVTITELIANKEIFSNYKREINKRILLPYYAIFPSIIIAIGLASIKSNRMKNNKTIILTLTFAVMLIFITFMITKIAKYTSLNALIMQYSFPVITLGLFAAINNPQWITRKSSRLLPSQANLL
ncbi:LptF/LptG family permease [Candidatus Deianiraea vastatrix]|uniref:ABC transporter permease n=1 Tax=Candidatus Deianiraea vastatrix TaxID=2163644 RepID=A0A5B8XGF2_9RICK|nr:LptF/LptG family permease [Candidatus Deianiraea vastatrix]QED23925.1 Putative ABC transporter permease [Candidatus Deianiraea vastatrix]